jgi:6-phosphogluconate dehydrogenase
MRLGFVGLGRMGGNMTRRLAAAGHPLVTWDRNADAIRSVVGTGVHAASSLDDLVAQLQPPRIVWVMVPAGEPTEQTVEALSSRLASGDVVIDGGNSHFKDDVRRAHLLAGRQIDYVDVGTSGGIWGAQRGYCLMIGGRREVVEHLAPIFRALAPGEGGVAAIPAPAHAPGPPSTAREGFLHCGPVGAGHFVKMIHNGIEYGLMQSYAEGFDILRNADSSALPPDQRYSFDLADIAEVWRRGSVVSSWLLDLATMALREDPQLDQFTGQVGDSGEGRWTVAAAIEESVPADVLTTALYTRFRSRRDHTFAEKLLSALRAQFGGHAEPR